MAKKFGKFLLFATAVGAACGGLYYYMKKEDAYRDGMLVQNEYAIEEEAA